MQGLYPVVSAATSSRLESLAERRQQEALLDDVAQLSTSLVQGRDPLAQICAEHLDSGGGKLRARMALAAASALDVDQEIAVGWGAACELMHNATLVHDDLQDRDTARRGRPTVWKRHGEAQAINAGDLLLTLPYRAVDLIPVEPAMRWFLAIAIAVRAEQTVRGQSLEMSLLNRRPWSRDDYDAAATGKTGALLGLPIEGIALVAGFAPEHARAVGDAFRDLGLLYQLQDDVIDLFGDKRRRRRGTDIFQGKITALVVEHARLHPDDHDWLYEILACPPTLTSADDVEAAASKFDEGGALAAVLARAIEHSAEVLDRPLFHAQPRLLALAQKLSSSCLRPMEELLSEKNIEARANAL